MEIDQLLKILPEGVSVVAVIFTVMVFLKHITIKDKNFEVMAKECHERQKLSQESFEKNINGITDRFCKSIDKQTEGIEKMRDTVHELVGKVG